MIDRRACTQALRADEDAYFRAAAVNERMLGGTLSRVAGFPRLPAASVLHGLSRLPAGSGWIPRLEARFRALGAARARLYCLDVSDRRSDSLAAAGYRRSVEIGFAGPAKGNHTAKVKLLECESESRWKAYAEVARACERTPDGHAASGDDYYRLCRLKAEAGYMLPFIARHGGSVAGFVNLSLRGRYGRYKNLLVHPDLRGRGIGTAMIGALRSEAARRGASTVLVYAIEGSAAVALYAGLGMVEVTRQAEWSKALD